MKNIYSYNFPIGKTFIADNETSITSIGFYDENIFYDHIVNETPLIQAAAMQIEEYLQGIRKEFNLPIDPSGTPFQKQVWNALLKIPYGETRSYKDIAISINNPKSYRAVGMANNKNPIMIVIPCHRVIGSNGNLVGYGGGLDIKESLLNLENKNRY